MKYTATAKYVRNSPRKVRLVARAIAGKKVGNAISFLSMNTKFASDPILKVLESALSNAKQKKSTDGDSLIISTIDVMGGPALKRWHAASRGMAHSYKKRMTHIKVVLTDGEENKEKKVNTKS